MSDSSPSPDDPDGTLYDPPDGTGAASASDDSVGLRLRLSEDEANRLRSVAQQLGLTPSTVAQRAIKMACEQVVTIQEDGRSPELLVDQYQARIDLLHAVGDDSSDPSLDRNRETENGASSSAESPPRPEKTSGS
ncbi:MAG: hypothetical protein ABEL97_15235 [Salinibacter sp.]